MKAKKILVFLLALMMIFSSLPVSVLAAAPGVKITTQPVGGRYCCDGSTETYTVRASGSMLRYQWYITYEIDGRAVTEKLQNSEDQTILGAISNTLTLRDFELCKKYGGTHKGDKTYKALLYCEVSDSVKTVTSKKVTIEDCPNLYIYGEPADTEAVLGGSAKFSVDVVSANSLDYVWYRIDGKNEIELLDYNNTAKYEYDDNSITIKNIERDEAEQFYYYCLITDCESGDEKYSDYASIKLIDKVTVTKNPENARQFSGVSAQFKVEATGGGTLTYQWYRSALGSDGTWSADEMIADAVSDTYRCEPTEENSGKIRFRCKVSNGASFAFSDYALLYLITPPKITKQPADTTVVEKSTAHFTVEAEGEGLRYFWEFSFKKANGEYTKWASLDEGTAELAVKSAAMSDNATRYRCKVVNSDNAFTYSEIATLFVTAKDAPPVITHQPVDATVYEGRPAEFSVDATASELTYKWQLSVYAGSRVGWREYTDAPGENTASTYTYPEAALNEDGTVKFRCVVSNGNSDKVYTNDAILHVKKNIEITAHPTDQTIRDDQVAQFTVEAKGENIKYQWYYNLGGAWTKAPGASSSYVYLFTEATLEMSGKVKFKCVLSNAYSDKFGSVESNEVTLYVSSSAIPTKITSQPLTQKVNEGDKVYLAVEAEGRALTYSWYKNGVLIEKAKNNLYTFNATYADNGAEFWCVVSGTDGTVTSNKAVITVVKAVKAPEITKNPANASVKEGDKVTFTVAATGDELTYQWYKNGTEIKGATGASYTFTASLADNGAKYKCTVKNSAGSKTSSEAALTVAKAVKAPEITKNPANASVKEGDKVTFTVAATGDELTYQWYKNGTEIKGATGASYTFTASLADNGAKYKCTVKNSAGSKTSSEAALTVKSKDQPKPMLVVGNVLGNGKDATPSVNDARAILRASVKLDVLTGIKLFLADVDGNGKITVDDARAALRISVKLDPVKYSNKY